MATARAKRPDPNVLAAAALLRCAPTWEELLPAIARAVDRDPQAILRMSEVRQLIREDREAERGDRLLSDAEAAKDQGVKTKTWQAWVRECPSLAALAEPGAGPRRWRQSKIRGWRP